MTSKTFVDHFPYGKNTPLLMITSSKVVILPILILFLLTTIPLCIYNTSPSLLLSLNRIPISFYPRNNSLFLNLSSHAVSTNTSITLSQSSQIATNSSTSVSLSLEIDTKSSTGEDQICTNGSTSMRLSPEADTKSLTSGSQSQKIDINGSISASLSLEIDTNSSTIESLSQEIDTERPTSMNQYPKVDINGSTALSLCPKIDASGSTCLSPSPEINFNDSTRINLSPDINTTGSTSLIRSKEIVTNDSTSVNTPRIDTNSSTNLYHNGIAMNGSTSMRLYRGCDISKGNWVPNPKGPYYTNETKCVIDDRQNCMKFGRPDTEFLTWRWKPHKCELPLFDAKEFLEIVRGKNLGFLGDSVGRNQMQSLVCLLASAANPLDVSHTPDTRFRRWHYKDYNFTIIALWSPLLVKSRETTPHEYLLNLYLDEPDEAWTAQIETIDILIISGGQWFFRPFVYYRKGKIVGCYICNKKKVKALNLYYGYRMAFRTVFQTLLKAPKFRALTFLRTFSPAHYENGGWSTGGDCRRQKPFAEQERKLDGFNLEFYKTQVEELRIAERRGKKRGLKFRMLETTEAMVMRPDGHPSRFGHWPHENKTVPDCVHWCLPGPIDTWNEFLLHRLRMEREDGLNQGNFS